MFFLVQIRRQETVGDWRYGRYNFLDDACRYTTLDKQEYIPVRPQTSVGVSTNSNYPWLGDVHIIIIMQPVIISNIVHN